MAISTESSAEATRVLDLSVRDVTVIPNGRDPREFGPGPRNHLQPRIGFVGHLSRTKRPFFFLDAIQRLRDNGVFADAYIAGDGPLLDRVRRAAAPLGVDVLGRVDDVAGLLAETDIFAFTSLAEGEGMPGVLIEAAMSGCATATTLVPGARDVIEHGRSGLVVAPDDLEPFAVALQRLCSDDAYRSLLARSAMSRSRARFTIDAVTAAWMKTLDDVLEVSCASSM